MQSINPNRKNVRFFDLAENFRFEFDLVLSYFATLFVVLLLALFISRLTLKINIRHFKMENIYSKLSLCWKHLFRSNIWPIKIALLFLTLFFWYTQLFLANNIKTNKVVVDTSDLIKNNIDLLKTRKIVCFFYKDTEMNLALRLSKSSILSKLFYEKTYFRDDQVKEKSIAQKDRCLLELDIKLVELIKTDNLLVLSEAECKSRYFLESISPRFLKLYFPSLAYFHLMFYSETNLVKKAWIIKNGIQDYNVNIYYSLRNSFNGKWLRKV